MSSDTFETTTRPIDVVDIYDRALKSLEERFGKLEMPEDGSPLYERNRHNLAMEVVNAFVRMYGGDEPEEEPCDV